MRTLLFVYGTLKTGYTNYVRYLQLAVTAGKAELLAHGTTEKKYPLVLRPLTRLPATRGPMLLSTHNSCESEWTKIDGEVYEIDNDTRQAMDILEGVSSGYYYREDIVVDLRTTDSDKPKQVVAECYFYNVTNEDEDLVEAKPLLSVYDDIAHDEYVPGPLNQDILNLLQR